jgi:hypothetical protein
MGNYRLRNRDMVVLMRINDVFSDDDLKRLKRYSERAKGSPLRLIPLPAIEIDSILSRLEAAEACIESHMKIWDVEVWRKSKGELK